MGSAWKISRARGIRNALQLPFRALGFAKRSGLIQTMYTPLMLALMGLSRVGERQDCRVP